MNGTLEEADGYCSTLLARLDKIPADVQPFVIPPFTALDRVSGALRDSRVLVGAQDVHWEQRGAFTGEVSAELAADAGAVLAEIGHSERRELFAETDDRVGAKVRAALDAGLRPLVCVGEPGAERDAGAHLDYVAREVRHAVRGAGADEEVGRLLFAYEPVWAIGEHGRPASIGEVAEMHAHLRSVLGEVLGPAGSAVPVFYGGSVNPDNASELLSVNDVDGLFVGRSAWTAAGLLEVIAAAAG